MDVDTISREDARRSGLCFNCGGKGHLVKDCPSPKQPRPRDSQGRFQNSSRGRFQNRGRGGGGGGGGQWRGGNNVRSAAVEEVQKDTTEEDLHTRVLKMSGEDVKRLLEDYIEANPDFHA